jgi:hypothetical protein
MKQNVYGTTLYNIRCKIAREERNKHPSDHYFSKAELKLDVELPALDLFKSSDKPTEGRVRPDADHTSPWMPVVTFAKAKNGKEKQQHQKGPGAPDTSSLGLRFAQLSNAKPKLGNELPSLDLSKGSNKPTKGRVAPDADHTSPWMPAVTFPVGQAFYYEPEPSTEALTVITTGSLEKASEVPKQDTAMEAPEEAPKQQPHIETNVSQAILSPQTFTPVAEPASTTQAWQSVKVVYEKDDEMEVDVDVPETIPSPKTPTPAPEPTREPSPAPQAYQSLTVVEEQDAEMEEMTAPQQTQIPAQLFGSEELHHSAPTHGFPVVASLDIEMDDRALPSHEVEMIEAFTEESVAPSHEGVMQGIYREVPAVPCLDVEMEEVCVGNPGVTSLDVEMKEVYVGKPVKASPDTDMKDVSEETPNPQPVRKQARRRPQVPATAEVTARNSRGRRQGTGGSVLSNLLSSITGEPAPIVPTRSRPTKTLKADQPKIEVPPLAAPTKPTVDASLTASHTPLQLVQSPQEPEEQQVLFAQYDSKRTIEGAGHRPDLNSGSKKRRAAEEECESENERRSKKIATDDKVVQRPVHSLASFVKAEERQITAAANIVLPAASPGSAPTVQLPPAYSALLASIPELDQANAVVDEIPNPQPQARKRPRARAPPKTAAEILKLKEEAEAAEKQKVAERNFRELVIKNNNLYIEQIGDEKKQYEIETDDKTIDTVREVMVWVCSDATCFDVECQHKTCGTDVALMCQKLQSCLQFHARHLWVNIALTVIVGTMEMECPPAHVPFESPVPLEKRTWFIKELLKSMYDHSKDEVDFTRHMMKRLTLYTEKEAVWKAKREFDSSEPCIDAQGHYVNKHGKKAAKVTFENELDASLMFKGKRGSLWTMWDEMQKECGITVEQPVAPRPKRSNDEGK